MPIRKTPDRCRHCKTPSRTARVHGLGHARSRARGSRPTSGLRTYILLRTSASGVKKVSLGPATRGIEEVRRECLAAAAVAEVRQPVREDVPLFRDFVAGVWKTACFNHWKPSTQRVTNRVLRSQLLPALGAVHLDRITHHIVVRWFEAYSRTAPGGANRVLDVLRQILNHAIVCGHIATQPDSESAAKSPHEAHPVPVARGNPTPSPGAQQLCGGFRVRAAASGHYPPLAVDRRPEERARAASPEGGGRRPPQTSATARPGHEGFS